MFILPSSSFCCCFCRDSFFLLHLLLSQLLLPATRLFTYLGNFPTEFYWSFPRANRPPTLTCVSSRAMQCYSSTFAFVTTLPWKYWKIRKISYVSRRTYSSAFCKFSTRLKLRCLAVTSPTASAAHHTLHEGSFEV